MAPGGCDFRRGRPGLFTVFVLLFMLLLMLQLFTASLYVAISPTLVHGQDQFAHAAGCSPSPILPSLSLTHVFFTGAQILAYSSLRTEAQLPQFLQHWNFLTTKTTTGTLRTYTFTVELAGPTTDVSSLNLGPGTLSPVHGIKVDSSIMSILSPRALDHLHSLDCFFTLTFNLEVCLLLSVVSRRMNFGDMAIEMLLMSNPQLLRALSPLENYKSHHSLKLYICEHSNFPPFSGQFRFKTPAYTDALSLLHLCSVPLQLLSTGTSARLLSSAELKIVLGFTLKIFCYQLLSFIQISPGFPFVQAHPSAEIGKLLFLPPVFVLSRQQPFDSFDGGVGTHLHNPSTLIYLLGFLGPSTIDCYWMWMALACVPILDLFGSSIYYRYWAINLGTFNDFGGVLVLAASYSFMMQPPRLDLVFIWLTSLPSRRSAVRESPIVMPLLKRAIFPGRFFIDQRLNSPLENLQTAIKSTIDGLVRAVSYWSIFGKYATTQVKYLDPIEGEFTSMTIEELSFYFMLCIVFRVASYPFNLWSEDAIKLNLEFVIEPIF